VSNSRFVFAGTISTWSQDGKQKFIQNCYYDLDNEMVITDNGDILFSNR
jgi:hypothetical protein